jgi:hypothetical protein
MQAKRELTRGFLPATMAKPSDYGREIAHICQGNRISRLFRRSPWDICLVAMSRKNNHLTESAAPSPTGTALT